MTDASDIASAARRGLSPPGLLFAVLGLAALLTPFLTIAANRIVAGDGVTVWQLATPAVTLPGVACIASALRRGLVDAQEQKRYELGASNLLAPFSIAGLGEWVEGNIQSSRTIYFHAGG